MKNTPPACPHKVNLPAVHVITRNLATPFARLVDLKIKNWTSKTNIARCSIDGGIYRFPTSKISTDRRGFYYVPVKCFTLVKESFVNLRAVRPSLSMGALSRFRVQRIPTCLYQRVLTRIRILLYLTDVVGYVSFVSIWQRMWTVFVKVLRVGETEKQPSGLRIPVWNVVSPVRRLFSPRRPECRFPPGDRNSP